MSGPRTGDWAIDKYLPTPGTFADAIYAVAMGPSRDEFDMAWMSHVAADVLNMPEMQAIRLALRQCAAREVFSDRGGVSTVRQGLECLGLPVSIIEWVLA